MAKESATTLEDRVRKTSKSERLKEIEGLLRRNLGQVKLELEEMSQDEYPARGNYKLGRVR